MSILQPILKDDIQIPARTGRKLLSIFDPAHYKNDKTLPLNPNATKIRPLSNENIKLPNLEQPGSIENEEENIKENDNEEEQFYNLKITKIVHEIMKHRILIKLKNNVMSLIDGKVILFSDLIKIMCSYNSFNYRIDLDELDRENLESILDYLDIVEWNKSRYMWENKEYELNKWFNTIENLLEFEQAVSYLRIRHILDYLSYRRENKKKKKAEFFSTQIDVNDGNNLPINNQNQNQSLIKNENIDSSIAIQPDSKKTKNFQEAFPPKFNPEKLSLELPVEIYTIRLNATKNFPFRGKINAVFKDKLLSEYVDAIISDSFWFVVAFFRSKNEMDKRVCEELKKTAAEILKRISCNYFKFFINLCDDDSPVKKKDPILNIFHDFLSQCVFYSLFLGFPKSRHIFNETFRHKIISLFAYLCNGLGTHSNFNVDHWDLDLGTGNIIEISNQTARKTRDEPNLVLPDIADFDNLIKNNIKTQDNFQSQMDRDNSNSKSALSTRILNTPLYRLYAEMNKFETLNMIKPIRMNQRKLLDIDHKDKIHHEYTKFAKDCVRSIAEERDKYGKFKEENDNKYNTKIKEIKSNTKRLKDEFNKIRIRRYQEYANYCIFISSK